MKAISLLVFQLLQTISPASAIAIDNGVLAASVQCTSESIVVNFSTKNPFNGRIFVKGMSEKPECAKAYADGNPPPPSPLITFTFGSCNMFRSRTLSPQSGLVQTLVVVVSFHKMFITKVDRAYKVQCFYSEAAERIVTSQLDVSMMSTESLRDTRAMPTCSYEVRRGDRNGEIIRHASVGEPVLHEWECKSDQFRILVKNCYVDDGQGNKQLIVDDRGCALDEVLMPDLTYDFGGNAKAWVESHVFKYADRTTVFFQCSIQLCKKGEAQCESVSPPICPRRQALTTGYPHPPARQRERAEILSGDGQRLQKRSPNDKAIDKDQSMEIDMLADAISVSDFDDSSDGTPAFHGSGVLPLQRPQERRVSASRRRLMDSLCMPWLYFAFVLCALIGFFISTAMLAIYVRMRRYLTKS